MLSRQSAGCRRDKNLSETVTFLVTVTFDYLGTLTLRTYLLR